jgi:uncharacterized protein
MIKRDIEDKIRQKLNGGKTIIIYGARQVGKTTLLHQIFDDKDGVLWLNGDIEATRERFEGLSLDTAQTLIGDHKIVIIDEAQRIENIGLKLKILQDNFGDRVQFVATGSSSFDLANKINEPMTGRVWTFQLFPLKISELVGAFGAAKETGALENRLIYGSYPDVVNNPKDAAEIVTMLSQENLYKDALNFSEIIKVDYLGKILKALAFQIGSQVSVNEIANLVGLDNKTVDKYISLLEQAFIIFRLPSFGKNLRNEIKTSQKIYFYDVGIRNGLIGDFRPTASRQDIGGLFENYIIAEYKKQNEGKLYFWRNYDGQEVDLLIEKNTEIRAVEVKWSKDASLPKAFVETYVPKEQVCINRDNYLNRIVEVQKNKNE